MIGPDPPPSQYAVDGVYYLDYMDTPAPGRGDAPDPDWSVLPYVCTYPENLAADDSMGGAGNCSWQWSLSANDVEGNPVMTGDTFIGPWRSYWRLRCGNTVIGSGPITGINIKLGDDFMSVAGQTWEAVLARWQYPFNPNSRDNLSLYSFEKALIGNETSPGPTSDNTPPGLAYECFQRDIALIAHDILVTVRDTVPDRLWFNFGDLNNPIGIKDNFQLSWGDDTSMDSFVNSLGGTGEGFDWWISWDRKFNFGSPYRFGSQMAPNINAFIDVDTDGLLDLEYDNNGIQGTHVLGKGAGFATQTTLMAAYGYALAQSSYTRLDISFDYGDVRNRASLVNKTKKSLALIIDPIREVPISMDPAVWDAANSGTFWGTFRKGVAIYITVDTGFNQIDAPYRLKSWSLTDENNTGNMVVALTCERIYPQPADFGNPDLQHEYT